MRSALLPRSPATTFIHIERIGWADWEWQVWGVPTKTIRTGTLLVLPTGHRTRIAGGRVWTERGARRVCRRIVFRYTDISVPCEISIDRGPPPWWRRVLA